MNHTATRFVFSTAAASFLFTTWAAADSARRRTRGAGIVFEVAGGVVELLTEYGRPVRSQRTELAVAMSLHRR